MIIAGRRPPGLGVLILLAAALFLTRPASGAAQTGGSQAEPADLILPGDVIRLKIWREPDLSGDFDINEAGVATLPKLGPMHVVNLTPQVLHDSLITVYSTYLNNPSIEVVHLRRVNILGAVKNPGSFTLDPTLTIEGALALAGGNTPAGKPDKVELHRGGQKIPVKLDAGTHISALPLRSGDQLFVPERSWISRNGAVVAALITGTIAIGIYAANHY